MSYTKIVSITSFIQKVGNRLHLKYISDRLAYGIQKIACPPVKKELNYEEARDVISKLHIDPHCSALRHNDIIKPFKWDLLVVLPVYNVEKFVVGCIESILNQTTKYLFHLTIVDDGSTDNSAELINRYANDTRVTIIKQKNRGLSGARNAGIEKIEAKYVTFVDSDDMLAPGAIEHWMNAAFTNDADIVEGSFMYRTTDGTLYGIHLKQDNNRAQMSDIWGYAWMKVFKAEMFQKICFPETYWNQDTVTAFLLLPISKKRVTIKDVVYYYTRNTQSISFQSRVKPKRLDSLYVTRVLLEDAEKMGFIKDYPYYYYEAFLKQVRMNRFRTESLGIDVEWAVFCIHCELFDKYFNGLICKMSKLKNIEKALKNKNITLYRKACILY